MLLQELLFTSSIASRTIDADSVGVAAVTVVAPRAVVHELCCFKDY